jgi:hypothetical protein
MLRINNILSINTHFEVKLKNQSSIIALKGK